MDVCRLEDFKEAFIKLDEAIDSEIHSGNSDFSDISPLIVKAIG